MHSSNNTDWSTSREAEACTGCGVRLFSLLLILSAVIFIFNFLSLYFSQEYSRAVSVLRNRETRVLLASRGGHNLSSEREVKIEMH